jgi:hypothetical protein
LWKFYERKVIEMPMMTTQVTLTDILEINEARTAADRNLEHQGVYRNDKAKGMACWRDCLAECNPEKCMGWRRVDAEHGYCVLVGCSWAEGLVF